MAGPILIHRHARNRHRGRDRQRKLNGIDSWYFEYVMESLPLILQAALLLLGCALCQYLWGIDRTVALVLLGVTALSVIFYLFVIAAGTAFESCPYQTPGSRILRSAPSAVASTTSIVASATSAVTSAFGRVVRHSRTVLLLRVNPQRSPRSQPGVGVTSSWILQTSLDTAVHFQLSNSLQQRCHWMTLTPPSLRNASTSSLTA